MSGFASFTMLGRLTRDVEKVTTQSGNFIAKFGVAVGRRVKRGETWEEETSFFDAVIFGARGEAFAKHHAKGDLCFLYGYPKQERWEDKTTRQPRTRIGFVADGWEFVGGARSTDAGGTTAATHTPDDTPF